MTIHIGINGFGRIGRNVFRAAMERTDVEIVAVNDLTDAQTLAMLLKYDSVHGNLTADVTAEDNHIVVNGKKVQVLAEREPGKIPWGKIGVELVVESTGLFTDKRKAEAHITQGGAKKVIISAPAKNEDITIVMGVNEHMYNPEQHHVVSNASCSTNCLAPVAKVIDDEFGITRGLMTAIHSYTNDQQILDLPHKDMRRARAAALNIIPTSTGAAKAVGLVLPHLEGKLNGMSMRVPTPNVSVVDLVAELKNPATVDSINEALSHAATGPLKGILQFSNEPLVSKDYNGDSHSGIVDGLSTMMMDNHMVKIIAWYDNEWGYSNRVVDLAAFIANKSKVEAIH
ncbi:glyceraldehyde-3-phosphate dehydrogenase [Alicyclobacillus acidoterrestris]|nr:glyceraldehyde-3-phosphate dehydrogenase [Alicyclobacillus acidoterrestris]